MRADEMDERFDAALRSYAEPPEMPAARMVLARVLASARLTESPRSKWWAWIIPAAGCAAAVVLAAGILLMRAPRGPQIAWTPRAPGVVSEAAPAVHAPARSQGSHATRSAKRAAIRDAQFAAERLPKLEVFPTPAPLTTEEQRLVSFTRHAPTAAQQQVLEERQHLSDPLQIAELKIQPLDTGDEQAKGKDNR
jgi:hypothetical protein